MDEKDANTGSLADEMRAYDILLKRHINDDRLMAERMSVFLLASSFLFVGFVSLLDVKGTCFLRVVVPSIGIVLCLLANDSAWRTSRGLSFWLKAEEKIENSGNSFKYMREQRVKVDCHEFKITPRSVFDFVNRGKVGWWLDKMKSRNIYPFVIPSLFLFMWVYSLIWVIQH